MENKRKIPYGVINWATLVRECLFVDNTAYIRRLENVPTPVFLRPKRFGKSVVGSMLAHYYDVSLKDRFDELFGKTDIGRNPTPLRNSFLVQTFDFSTVQVGSPKPARLVEFKYFTNAAAEKGNVLGRDTPDAETVKQALDYRTAFTYNGEAVSLNAQGYLRHAGGLVIILL